MKETDLIIEVNSEIVVFSRMAFKAETSELERLIMKFSWNSKKTQA